MEIKGDGKKGFNVENNMNCETFNQPLESKVNKN